MLPRFALVYIKYCNSYYLDTILGPSKSLFIIIVFTFQIECKQDIDRK